MDSFPLDAVVLITTAPMPEEPFNQQVAAIKATGATWQSQTRRWMVVIEKFDHDAAKILTELFRIAKEYGTVVDVIAPKSPA
jgi:hypothetical protein